MSIKSKLKKHIKQASKDLTIEILERRIQTLEADVKQKQTYGHQIAKNATDLREAYLSHIFELQNRIKELEHSAGVVITPGCIFEFDGNYLRPVDGPKVRYPKATYNGEPIRYEA